MRLEGAINLILKWDVGRVSPKYWAWKGAEGSSKGAAPSSATVGNGTYIKIIRMTHLQATVPPGRCRLVAVTDDVFEVVATSPLAGVSSHVAFHCVVV